MFEALKQLVVNRGGYVHPSLVLLDRDEAEHGLISLSGVNDDELSLKVAKSLAESRTTQGVWIEFLRELGYIMDERFWSSHSFAEGVLPLLGAANHGLSGSLSEDKNYYYLHGTTFEYSNNKDKLRHKWGIE